MNYAYCNPCLLLDLSHTQTPAKLVSYPGMRQVWEMKGTSQTLIVATIDAYEHTLVWLARLSSDPIACENVTEFRANKIST